MSNLIAVIVTLALFVIFPVFIFVLLVRAVRIPGTRWWGIVILLSILTCYCTTMTVIVGMISGGSATGTASMEQRYCERFRDALTQTETLPDAVARMDAVAASEEYQVKEPDKNLRFRFVWLLGGCFLFAIANLMMFGPGRREHRHPTDCMVAIVAALVVFLTGIWQIAWGNGYAVQASLHHRMLTGWHEGIPLDAVPMSNAEIAAKLNDDGVRNLNVLRMVFRRLSGEYVPRLPNGTAGGNASAAPGGDAEKSGDATPGDGVEKSGSAAPGGIAIIGGADGPTSIFIGSELLKKQAGAPAGNEAEANLNASDAAD